ncbi:MAG: GNAT family N-acetyltransferase [Acidimicrobiia bacterium]
MRAMEGITIRALRPDDHEWAERIIGGDHAGRMQARRGELVDALSCPGFVAEDPSSRVGLLTYRLHDDDAEIVYIEAVERLAGIGTALLDSLLACAAGRRAWVVTTNDNVDALRFYQRRGFVITEVRPGAVAHARRTLKPRIPEVGSFGIPIRDEIELEYEAPAAPQGRTATPSNM